MICCSFLQYWNFTSFNPSVSICQASFCNVACTFDTSWIPFGSFSANLACRFSMLNRPQVLSERDNSLSFLANLFTREKTPSAFYNFLSEILWIRNSYKPSVVSKHFLTNVRKCCGLLCLPGPRSSALHFAEPALATGRIGKCEGRQGIGMPMVTQMREEVNYD